MSRSSRLESQLRILGRLCDEQRLLAATRMGSAGVVITTLDEAAHTLVEGEIGAFLLGFRLGRGQDV